MSEEDVSRLRGLYEAWAEGDFASGGELFAEDVVFAPGSPGDRPVRGLGAVGAHMRDFLQQWRDFHVIAEDFAPLGSSGGGDTILVTERQFGIGEGSGVSLDQTFFAVWTFRDGRVVSVSWHTERARALAAADVG